MMGLLLQLRPITVPVVILLQRRARQQRAVASVKAPVEAAAEAARMA